MFNLFARKQTPDATAAVRRIIDLTTSRMIYAEDDQRNDTRYSRSLPLMVTVCDMDGKPALDRTCMAVSCDISDCGLSLTSYDQLDENEYIVSVWPDRDEFLTPTHLRCNLVNSTSLAHGVWKASFKIQSIETSRDSSALWKLDRVAQLALRPKSCEPAGV